MITTSDIDIVGVASPTESWHYCNKNGQFICNSNVATKSDPSVNYDAL
jgi:hypothetical protein